MNYIIHHIIVQNYKELRIKLKLEANVEQFTIIAFA